jgi:hypothetical protein
MSFSNFELMTDRIFNHLKLLYAHSKKLAITFNFVTNANTSLIQVTKNLRVCGGCAIRKCTIIVRDAQQIHHFYLNA